MKSRILSLLALFAQTMFAQIMFAQLMPADQLKKNLEEIGIGDNAHVVFYADWDPMATRLFFTLDYLGFTGSASLLDGSMEQWVLEKRPVSSDDPKITPGNLTVNLHP